MRPLVVVRRFKNVDPATKTVYYVNSETKTSQWECPEECAAVLRELEKIDRELDEEEAAANKEDDLLFDHEREQLKHEREKRALNEAEKAGKEFTGRATTQSVEFTGEDKSDPFHVPHELINEFAPQELTEAIEQFQEFDEDGSMGIKPLDSTFRRFESCGA